MQRFFFLYKHFVFQYIKTLVQSKVDFAMGMVAFVANQIFGITFLFLVFQEIKVLNLWDFDELLFLYGFLQIVKGIDHFFTDNLWSVAWYQVRRGGFDKYLLRPAGVLLQIVSEKIQFDGIGEIVLGMILIGRIFVYKELDISLRYILIMLLLIASSTMIFTSVKVVVTSLAFWIKESGEILEAIYQISDFARYPISIYPHGLKNIIVFIIPFAWVSYYPSCILLGKSQSALVIVVQLCVTLVVVLFAKKIFTKGLEKYDSSGN